MIHHLSSTAQKNIKAAVAIANPGFSKLTDPHTYLEPPQGFPEDATSAA
jgi:hypothetical protein